MRTRSRFTLGQKLAGGFAVMLAVTTAPARSSRRAIPLEEEFTEF